MSLFHEVSQWWFFHEVPQTPCSVTGLLFIGFWARIGYEKWSKRK